MLGHYRLTLRQLQLAQMPLSILYLMTHCRRNKHALAINIQMTWQDISVVECLLMDWGSTLSHDILLWRWALHPHLPPAVLISNMLLRPVKYKVNAMQRKKQTCISCIPFPFCFSNQINVKFQKELPLEKFKTKHVWNPSPYSATPLL